MSEEGIRILLKDNRIVTMKELFEGKEESRREIARLSFEEKIRALVDLQKLAYSWGNRKDVLVWRL